ncbi:hypothetical protein R6Q57_003364 [Mikania cordata]
MASGSVIMSKMWQQACEWLYKILCGLRPPGVPPSGPHLGEAYCLDYFIPEDLCCLACTAWAKRRRTKRVVINEDIYHMKKMEELANERLRFFCKQDLREQQAKETKKSTKSKRKRSTTCTYGEDDHKKKIPPKGIRTPSVTNETTKRLKEFIANEMKGTDMKLVIQKTLYKSDTEKGLNRLNMPMNQLENDDFLTVDEIQILNKRTQKVNEIEVRLLGPTLEMYKDPMKLKMWHMSSTANYVLTTHWHRFWVENKVHLPKDAKIQVWSFRRDQQLCFAVVCVEELKNMHGECSKDDNNDKNNTYPV